MPAAQTRRAEALVLRRVDYGDADLVVTLLTNVDGKRSAFARGARKSRRRFAGALEPFRLIEVTYRDRRSGDLAQLFEATVLEAFDGVTADLHRLCWGSLALEWTAAISVEGQSGRLFETTVELLRWLGQHQRSPWFTEVGCLRYGLVLLAESGVLPSLDRSCRSGLPLGELSDPLFSPAAGGVVDAAEVRPEDRTLATERATLEFLLAIARGRFPSERELPRLRDARRLVLASVTHIIETAPKSLAMLQTVWL